MNALYYRLRTNKNLNLFIYLTRYLIGFAFIPSGLTKLKGARFTKAGTDTTIGYFFEALYQTGTYWQFLGGIQLLAAFLLMSQRFATVGAILFLTIMGNIWVITMSMNFSGTYIITSLMLLANLMLIAWDWYKIKFMLYPDNFRYQDEKFIVPPIKPIWITIGTLIFFLSLGSMIMLSHFK
ncbi:DoxX-like protein [Pedobacter psychrotolerans]|uniref:DoxX-like protein n=1 Tax=Pedobacter psychrotolerans TaxID=1843235 RepID=A0A4R2H7V5_9SPHI|nr:DoxX family membrane protein [Pedobacter psychrotolerans]TCO22575.1 DoxX-like protein [Pedobacter psychrotolerans]GGE65613.1 hypothetical protein GCM10011413_35100 [Pedobacter psychrotolerans]